MREVFGERGNPYDSAARAIKPTEVGDAAKRPNHDKTQVNTARRDISGCPRRGGRCGDRVQGSIPIASRRELSLKKGSSGIKERHQFRFYLNSPHPFRRHTVPCSKSGGSPWRFAVSDEVISPFLPTIFRRWCDPSGKTEKQHFCPSKSRVQILFCSRPVCVYYWRRRNTLIL